MAWSASERFEVRPAPGGLFLVQELLNTAPGGRPRNPDLLDTLASAQPWLDGVMDAWAGASGRGRERVALIEGDLDELKRLRTRLRQALSAAGPEAAAGAGDALLAAEAVTLRLAADATVTVEPRGDGARRVTSAVLAECLVAQTRGVWPRLKICRYGRCAVAFYDHSRNSSAVWHDARVCGNTVNLRASRERRRARPQG
ncbi:MULTISPECIES: CGNR zinc finger domain-containing protein [unclassified Streptomyces]|uniref:CGNR zinc finger domain-containing protein n=1 Tax=unclassified Streptomyces TaxID=2593676 RepID=UPI00382436AC